MATQTQVVEYLRVERRSYLWGSILVLLIVYAAQFALMMMHLPHGALVPSSAHMNSQVLMQQMHQQWALMQKITREHPIAFMLLSLSGTLATLILNMRISMLINRPRGAFGPESRSALRWTWLLLLAAGPVLLPPLEIVFIVLLTRWASQEIRARAAASGAGAGPAQAVS